MTRLANFIFWLQLTRFILWNVRGPAEGEWMLWAGDWLECCGRYMVATNWDRDGFTFTLVNDADREFEPDCWEWRIGATKPAG